MNQFVEVVGFHVYVHKMIVYNTCAVMWLNILDYGRDVHNMPLRTELGVGTTVLYLLQSLRRASFLTAVEMLHCRCFIPSDVSPDFARYFIERRELIWQVAATAAPRRRYS